MGKQLQSITTEQEYKLNQLSSDCDKDKYGNYARPTVALALKWLWNERTMYVWVGRENKKFYFYISLQGQTLCPKEGVDDPEQAESAGLDYALDYLLKDQRVKIRFNGKAGTSIWYHNLVGQEMLVKDKNANWYETEDGQEIFKRDADLIRQEQDYPNIKATDKGNGEIELSPTNPNFGKIKLDLYVCPSGHTMAYHGRCVYPHCNQMNELSVL